MEDYVGILEDLKTTLYVCLSGVQEQNEIDKALDVAIKTLKQESILDRIRAEIDAHREKLKIMDDDDWYAGKIRGYDCAIEIIDKYRQG